MQAEPFQTFFKLHDVQTRESLELMRFFWLFSSLKFAVGLTIRQMPALNFSGHFTFVAVKNRFFIK